MYVYIYIHIYIYTRAVAIVTEDRYPPCAPDRNTLPQPYINSGLATRKAALSLTVYSDLWGNSACDRRICYCW